MLRDNVAATIVSVGVTLFSARRAGRSLLHGINLAYRVQHERSGIRRQLVSMLLVLGCAALLLTALVSLSVLAFLQSYVPDGLPGARLVSTIILFGSLTLGAGVGLIVTYRYAPACDAIPWRHALPGTIAGVVMWLCATLLFRIYVSRFASFDDTYGSLAAVVVLMLWLMVSAWVLLLGARLNAEAMRRSGAHYHRKRRMTDIPVQDRYRNRLLTIIAAIMIIAALRIGFAVTMPIAFAAITVAALWPLKRWLAGSMPSWLAYTLTMLALVVILGAFAAAVYLSIGQVIAVMASQWPGLERSYGKLAVWAANHGVPLSGTVDRQRIVAVIQMLASGVYAFVTYVGFIALVVMLGLPEVPRFRRKLHDMLDGGERRGMLDVAEAISGQIRRYLGTTLATSILTGVASALWSWMTGL